MFNASNLDWLGVLLNPALFLMLYKMAESNSQKKMKGLQIVLYQYDPVLYITT